MKQAARNRTLNSLRQGRTRLLVATDVAARGIDVPGITHVINYDLPKSAEDYVHRIGRTGRAGRAGQAVSLVGPRDRSVLRRIEQFTDQRIEVAVLAGLEPQRRTEDRPRRTTGSDKPRWNNSDRKARDSRSDRHEPRREGSTGGYARREPGNEAFPAREPGNSIARPEQGGYPPRRDSGFAPRPARPDGGNGYAPRREGFTPRSDSNGNAGNGFPPRREGGFAGRRDDRPRPAGAGAGFRGRDDRRDGGFRDSAPRDAGFDRPRRTFGEERVEVAPQEVAVSYARPRRQRPEGEARPAAAARRPSGDSFFDERP
jgi:superfamily II DNA/RNA helicase